VTGAGVQVVVVDVEEDGEDNPSGEGAEAPSAVVVRLGLGGAAMDKPVSKVSIIILLIVLLLWQNVGGILADPPIGPTWQGAAISPNKITVELAPGQSTAQRITVITAEAPIPKVDILLLLDVTSSMTDEMEVVKENAAHILNTIGAKVEDVAFGVASFVDYPHYYDYAGYAAQYGTAGDYPWSLDQDITTDKEAVQKALDALIIRNGGDAPEDYSRALFESIFVSWRAGAKKIVVLFGDSVAHDVEFYQARFGRNFGVDPGEDEEAGTGDDLVFTDVVAKVREQRIEVISINCALGEELFELVEAGFRYVAEQTNGQVFSIDEAHQVPEAVIRGLEAATIEIAELTLMPEAPFTPWVSIAPPLHRKVGGGETRTFDVTITVPEGTDPGTYSFNLDVLGDGASLGLVEVTVEVVLAKPPLDVNALLIDKRAIADFLSAPRATVRILDLVDIPFEPKKNYRVQEKEVMRWVGALEARHVASELTLEEAIALQRLAFHEDAIQELFDSDVRLATIIGHHTGNIVGLVWSLLKWFKFLDHVSRKHVVGRLVTKIRRRIEAKMVDYMETFILWVAGLMPPGEMQIAFKGAALIAGEYIKRGLDEGGSLKEILLEGGAYLVIGATLVDLFVSNTQGEISDGLEGAEKISAMSMDPLTALDRNRRIEEEVSFLISSVKARTYGIEEADGRIRQAQKLTKMVADVADVGAMITTATGVGGVVGAIMKGLAILTRLVDAAMSVTVIGQSAQQLFMLPGIASEVTTTVFEEVISSSEMHLFAMAPDSAHSSIWLVSFDVPEPEASFAITAKVLSEVHLQYDNYRSILQKLADAVRRGDKGAIERLTEELVEADEALSQRLAVARAPIFAGAGDLITGEGEEFDLLYEQFGKSAAEFDLQGVSLYILLLWNLSDPSDLEAREATLKQIEATLASLDRYTKSIEDALPLIAETAKEPMAIVSGYQLPEEVIIGKEFSLHVDVSNPTPLTAENVAVEVVTSDELEILSASSVILGNMGPGAEKEAQFTLRLTGGEDALITLQTTVANGSGETKLIYISASKEITPPQPAWLLLMVLMLGLAAIVFVIVTRTRPMYGVRVVQGYGPMGLVGFRRGVINIGRDPRNDLVLFDKKVSRHHAQIRLEGRWPVIYDLRSTNGTFVNGQRVTRQVLRDGDEIRVGDTKLIFRMTWR
jgi:hypothetical protein